MIKMQETYWQTDRQMHRKMKTLTPWRQTDRQRKRNRQIDRQRQTDRETDRQRQTDRERQRQRERGRQTDSETQRERQRERERDRESETERQSDRHMDKKQAAGRQMQEENSLTHPAIIIHPSWSTISTSSAEGGEQNLCWNICRTDSTVLEVSCSDTATWPRVRIVLVEINVDSLEMEIQNYSTWKWLSSFSLHEFHFHLRKITSLCHKSQFRIIVQIKFEPRHEKTCLQGLRPCKTQTGLHSHRS